MKQLFLLGLLLSGCTLRVAAPILPNVNLKGKVPDATSKINITAGTPLSTTSRTSGQTGNKQLVTDVPFSDGVASDTQLDPTKNCAQMVKLNDQNGAVVVDFLNAACPSDSTQLGDPSTIVFTAQYANNNDIYILQISGSDIGQFEFNSDGTQATVTGLCSGSYSTKCYLPVVNGVIQKTPVILGQ